MWSDQKYYYSDSNFQLELNLQAIRRSLIQTLDDFEAEDCKACSYLKCRCEKDKPEPPVTQSQGTEEESLNETKPSSPRPQSTSPIQLVADTTKLSLNGATPPQSLTGPTPPQSLTGPTPPQSLTGPTPPRSEANGVQEEQNEDLKSPPATDLPRPTFKTSSDTSQPPKDVESWVRASTPNPEKTDSPGSKPYKNPSWPQVPNSIWNDYKNKISRPEINTGTVSQAGNVQDFFKSFNMNMYGNKAYARNKALMQKLKVMAAKQKEYSYF